MQSFADGTVLAARLLYLGSRGWLWWRRFGAFGALPVDADEIEEIAMQPREGDGADEYFALVLPVSASRKPPRPPRPHEDRGIYCAASAGTRFDQTFFRRPGTCG